MYLLRLMDDKKCYPLKGNPDNPDERAYPDGVDGEPRVLQVAGVNEDGETVGDMSTDARKLMQQEMINLLEPYLSSGLCKSSMSGEVWGKNQKLVGVCSRCRPRNSPAPAPAPHPYPTPPPPPLPHPLRHRSLALSW